MNEIMPNKRRESKKAIIIAGAQKVFSTKGFLNVTMQDIIDACGISRGGIYLYFRATDDIFLKQSHNVLYANLMIFVKLSKMNHLSTN